MATLDELLNRLSIEDRTEVERNANKMIIDYQLQLLHEELQTSQQQLADAMGISQPALPTLENHGSEITLSTLKHYVETMGGKLRIDVELPTGKHVGFRI